MTHFKGICIRIPSYPIYTCRSQNVNTVLRLWPLKIIFWMTVAVVESSSSSPPPLLYNIRVLQVTGKVKCTLVQAVKLCTGRTANRGSRGIALPLRDHGTRRVWGVSVTPQPLFTPGKDPIPIVQEAGWAPGPVWTGAENLAPTGIRSPDRPVRSQSLYRLRYPTHQVAGHST
jgi:hypothetical protein